MTKMRLNLILFVLFLALVIVSRFVDFTPKSVVPPDAPEVYRESYSVLDQKRVSLHVVDSSRPVALIIVDAWGVSYDKSILAEDFAIFNDVPHHFAIHKRLRNKTQHAQGAEIKDDFEQVSYDDMDSLLSDSTYKRVATTIHPSQDGDRENLHKALSGIQGLVKKYPETIFIIQGAHRPILGTPETRKKYYAHWVPVVFGNYLNHE